MATYERNRACDCARCRARGLMGPVVLITMGLLFLLQEFTRWDFHETWPVLFIVIGLVKVLQSSMPTAGHWSGQITPPEPPATPGAGGESSQQVEHV